MLANFPTWVWKWEIVPPSEKAIHRDNDDEASNVRAFPRNFQTHYIYIYIKTLGGLISHISHHPGPPVLLLSPLVSSGPLRSCAGGPFWGQSSQGREPGGESVRTLPTLQGWPSVSGSAWLRFTSFLHLRPPNKVLDLRGVFNLQK